MKIKNLLALTAMAAMAFTACNKDENGAGVSDNTPKSVTLSLKMSYPEPVPIFLSAIRPRSR